MSGYLVTSDAVPETSYRRHSSLPPSYVEDVEALQAGWLDVQANAFSRVIDARLRKVCSAVPFDPVPTVIKTWLVRLLDIRILVKLGIDPTGDAALTLIAKDAETAAQELAEAASGELSKFDIPLSDEDSATAITKKRIRSYSEQSPFVWKDLQRAAGRTQDRNGRGE